MFDNLFSTFVVVRDFCTNVPIFSNFALKLKLDHIFVKKK